MAVIEKQKRRGFLLVVLAGALWGTTGTLSKYIFAFGVDPMSLALLRIGISFFSLYIFALITGRRVRVKQEDLPLFFLFGLVSVALFNIAYLTAINLTTVSTAVVMLYTAPAFSMILARIILKESLTTKKIVALILTFIGIFLVMEAYRPGQLALNIPGVIAGLASGFTYGAYSIFSKGAIRRGYGTLETVIIALGMAMLILSVLHPPWRLMPLVGAPFMLWVFVVAVAVFCTMLAYVFFVSGLVHIEAGKATLIAAIEPVVAILVAMVFLGETLTIFQGVGVVAVLAAIRGQLD